MSSPKNIIKKSKESFGVWSKVPIKERVKKLRPLGKLLDKNITKLSRRLTLDMGKPIVQSQQEVKKCAYLVDELTRWAPVWLKSQDLPQNLGTIVYRPLGPVLGIMPWNYPYWQSLRFFLGALCAGNSVILKPAPLTNPSQQLLQKLLEKLDLPENLVQTVLFKVEESEEYLSNPDLRGVSLTGSTNAGKIIGQMAGKYLKKCVLELGGSDPFIIMPNAKIDHVIHHALEARLQNSGQSCIASKRFLVHESQFENFVKLLDQGISSYKIGDPMKEKTTLGPLSSIRAKKILMDQVTRAIKAGAIVLNSQGIKKAPRNFVNPIILEMAATNPLYQEEFFGPTFIVTPFKNLDECVWQANVVSFGLGASIWGAGPSEKKKLADSLEVGMISFDKILRSHPLIPFGGVKESGLGKELGEWGIKEFTCAQVRI